MSASESIDGTIHLASSPLSPMTAGAASGESPLGGAGSPETSASDEDDELFLVGERIADLAARINAAEGKMLELLADFDRREGWKGEFSSCAEWLAWRTGTKIGPAREKVRAARALASLPQTAEALRTGRLSYTKVRAITRVATPENEGTLLEFARAASAARLEQRVRLWKQLSREGELTAEQVRHRNRAFSVFVDGDGMYVVRGRLEPEVGAVLMRAVEAAGDALYRQEGEDGDEAERVQLGGKATLDKAAARRTAAKPKQRRADAVRLLAERALAAGFDGDASRDGGPGRSGTRAERYQVIIHADAATLAEEGEPGRSDLDGVRVSAETSRRMTCDAATVTMVHERGGSDASAPAVGGLAPGGSAKNGPAASKPIASKALPSRRIPGGLLTGGSVVRGPGPGGPVLSVGRRTRTIPPHIRRALEERDRSCRFPGCAGRFTEAHHIRHWADGGDTSLGNLLLLCRRHHRAVHEGRVKVGTNRDGVALFFTRSGRVLVDAPERPQPMPRSRGNAAANDAGLPRPPERNGPFSNGAALFRDAAIPWEVEAAAREAVEETL